MIVEVGSVTKILGNKEAIKDVSFKSEVDRLIILGHNGSGKTTLLSMLIGVLKPDKGKISIDGINPCKERDKILKKVSFTFEKPKFDINVKVKDYYNFMKEIADSDCVEMFWSQLGLSEAKDSMLSDLSSGQGQAIQLMQAICRNSEIKVLDEPFSHLDYVRAGIIGEYIVRKGLKIIMTTHVPEEADWLAEHVVILKDGKLVWSGKFEELNQGDYFEVMVRGSFNLPNVVAKVGNILIVKSSIEELTRLMSEGKIMGFKRVGVRRYYESYKVVS
jgi:ABC-2 type transport system ATP-binding protein